MAPSSGESRPPVRLGPYTLREKIGAGGMGEVHLAYDSRLERKVALKLLPVALREDEERRTRFLREARAAAQLSHPNITQIFEVGEADGTDYIAFELVDGETLASVVQAGPLELQRIVELALPLADALAYAHERGVLHRDLKAANVMVTSRGHPKLLDFGLAKLLQEGSQAPGAKSTTLTMQGAIFGTPAAMSPEQALGRPLDVRSDVFSFGSLLYELAAGRPAFTGATAMEVMDAVIHREAPPLSRVRPELPHDFVAIVDKALRKDPAERYQSMGDLTADLRHFKRTTDSGLVPPGSRRRPALGRLLAFALSAVALGAVAWSSWRSSQGPTPAPEPGRPPLLAVVGFENLADPADVDALGRMLTGLVTTDLAEHAGVRVVSTSKVLAALEEIRQGASGRFEAATATRAARAVDASLMLVGQIARAGAGLLLTAELVDVGSGEARGSVRAEAASADEVFALAERVSESVRGHLGLAEEQDRFDLTSLTGSAEAYRQFSAGELAMHNRDFPAARTFFQRAVETDPEFAMAWWRLGLTKSWLEPTAGVEEYEQAAKRGHRLSERWRTVCAAAIARLRGDYDTAYDRLLPLIEADVDIPDAHNEFGEVLTHCGKYRDPPRARRAFARALEIDPRFELVAYHLMNELIAAEDFTGARALLARVTHGGKPGYGSVALPLAERRYAEALAIAETEVEANGQTDWESYVIAARCTDDEERFARALAAWRTGAAGDRHWQQMQSGIHEFRRGRFDKAFTAFDVAVRLNPMPYVRSWVSVIRAACRYGIGDDEGAVAAARAAVESDPYEFLAWFWLGAAEARLQRLDEANATLATGRQRFAESKCAVGASILDSLEAVILAAAGDALRAGAVLASSQQLPPERRQREYELLAAARVAEAAGDVAAARAAWDRLVEPVHPRHTDSVDLVVWPLYERARLEHEHGDPAAARDLLRRFLDRWGGADREIAPVTDASRRLAELGK